MFLRPGKAPDLAKINTPPARTAAILGRLRPLNSGSPGTLIASCFFAFLSTPQKSQLTKTKTSLWFDVSNSPRLDDSSLPVRRKLAIALAQTDTVPELNSIHLHDRDATLIADQFISHPEKLPP